jgi:glycerol-3-phosphate cytidylyltransferase-like family protein
VVSVTKDQYVNKGKGRPVFTCEQRMEMLRELRCVSEVVPCMDALDALVQVNPDIFVKGKEYKGKLDPEDEEFCKEAKIKIVFTDTPKFSSTQLLRYYESRRG